MAKKISQLTSLAAASAVATDEVEVARSSSSTSYRMALSALRTWLLSTAAAFASTVSATAVFIGTSTTTASETGTVSTGISIANNVWARAQNAAGSALRRAWRVNASNVMEIDGEGAGVLLGGGAAFNGRSDDGISVLQNVFSDIAARARGYTSEATRTNASSHVVFVNPNGTVGSISTSGSATSFNTSSDERLKQDIVDLGDVGATIDAIRPVEFGFKANPEERVVGFIAQDLHEVFPDAVSVGADDLDEQGRLLNPWSVDRSALVPLLVREIQSLRLRLAAIEAA